MKEIDWFEYDKNIPDEDDLCVVLTPFVKNKNDQIRCCKFTDGSFIDFIGNTFEACVTHFIVINNAEILIDNLIFSEACRLDNLPTLVDW